MEGGLSYGVPGSLSAPATLQAKGQEDRSTAVRISAAQVIAGRVCEPARNHLPAFCPRARPNVLSG